MSRASICLCQKSMTSADRNQELPQRLQTASAGVPEEIVYLQSGHGQPRAARAYMHLQDPDRLFDTFRAFACRRHGRRFLLLLNTPNYPSCGPTDPRGMAICLSLLAPSPLRRSRPPHVSRPAPQAATAFSGEGAGAPQHPGALPFHSAHPRSACGRRYRTDSSPRHPARGDPQITLPALPYSVYARQHGPDRSRRG